MRNIIKLAAIGFALAAAPASAGVALYSFSGIGTGSVYSYTYDAQTRTYIRPITSRTITGIAFSGSFAVDLALLPANASSANVPTNLGSVGSLQPWITSNSVASAEGYDFGLTTEGKRTSVLRYSEDRDVLTELSDETDTGSVRTADSWTRRFGRNQLALFFGPSDTVNGLRLPTFGSSVSFQAWQSVLFETYVGPRGELGIDSYDQLMLNGTADVTLTGVEFDVPPPPPPPPPGPGVPEPDSWAMLIAGFGLLGWARRRIGAGARRRGRAPA